MSKLILMKDKNIDYLLAVQSYGTAQDNGVLYAMLYYFIYLSCSYHLSNFVFY